MAKDWTGNSHSTFVITGAVGHSKEERETNDYYATSPEAAEHLLEIEPNISDIWECAVGEGHLAEVFRKAGKLKAISDLVDRGYHPEDIKAQYFGKSFLEINEKWTGDIVTNPPYAIGKEWVEHSLSLLKEGHYLALFLKLTFLEGKNRKDMFKQYPPVRVWVSSSRIPCAMNGEFEKQKVDKHGNPMFDKDNNPIMEKQSSATAYAWFIWQKGYTGSTEIKWFN